MAYLVYNLWLCLLFAAAIGLATGWWFWAARAAEADAVFEPAGRTAESVGPPPPDLETETVPEPEPEPEMAPPPETPADPVMDPVPTAAMTAPAPAPVSQAEPETASSPFLAAPDGEPDDLTRIKGVGPKLADALNDLGVYHFRQIAGWDEAQVGEVDSRLGAFKGRIERDRWVDQSQLLADRNVAAFEREFGKLNGPI